jgi:RNA polymerase-associated protein CTR9
MQDPYAVLSLANVFLFAAPTDQAKRDTFLMRVEKLCASVLSKDRFNAYAANGIGCVLAYKREFLRAKEVFIKVRRSLCSGRCVGRSPYV